MSHTAVPAVANNLSPEPLRRCGLPSRLLHLRVLHLEAFRRLQTRRRRGTTPASARARDRLRPAPSEAATPSPGRPSSHAACRANQPPARRPHRRRARPRTVRPWTASRLALQSLHTTGQRTAKEAASPRPPWRLPAYAARALRRVRGRHLLRCLRVAGFAPLLVPWRCRSRRASTDSAHELLPHPRTGRSPPTVT
jgi:hypothetical protein